MASSPRRLPSWKRNLTISPPITPAGLRSMRRSTAIGTACAARSRYGSNLLRQRSAPAGARITAMTPRDATIAPSGRSFLGQGEQMALVSAELGPALEEAATEPDAAAAVASGEVFTRRWVVELI